MDTELIEAAKAVGVTIRSKNFVRASGKNPNAGFVDLRDWYALLGEVARMERAITALSSEARS